MNSLSFFSFFDKKNAWSSDLWASHFETVLGPMVAVADQKSVFLLEFLERKKLRQEILRLQQCKGSNVLFEENPQIRLLREEIDLYFQRKLTSFQTPIDCIGTPFQKKVWQELKKIPFGQTCSYGEIACKIGQPSAFRAAATAVGANSLAIVIPCHRVIRTNGKIGGYAGGLPRKYWLLDHEMIKLIP